MKPADPARTPCYRGLFPVVPTTFTEAGELDLASQKRCVDFMIDAGSDGLALLANYSEQFLLADDERERLTRTILEHVAGRAPVIVTTTHFSTKVCSERSRRAQDMGAAMVMVMPPYHGATFRVPEERICDFFARLSDAVGIPIMIQDAPAAGTPLSASFLARMAREIEHVSYFKIETAGAAAKLRELIRLGGDAVEGPWDGEEADHLAARPRSRRHRRHDRGRLPGRHPPDPRCVERRPPRRCHRGLRALAAADQPGESSVRLPRGQGPDEGRRHHRLRSAAPPLAAAAPCQSQAPDRDRPPARCAGAALGPLSGSPMAARRLHDASAATSRSLQRAEFSLTGCRLRLNPARSPPR
jgi:hypothetical protein